MPRRVAVCWLLAVAGTAWSLDVPGGQEPSYLATQLRPDWRRAALAEVLLVIEQAIELPVARSEGVAEVERMPVVFVDGDRRPLREVLSALEHAYDLHFIAEPLRLLVLTAEDARDRRRRPVEVQLGEYVVALQRSSTRSNPPLGFASGSQPSGGGGGFDLMGGGGGFAGPHLGVSAEQLAALLEQVFTGTHLRLGETGQAFLSMTPEEERAMRDLLAERFAEASRTSTWRIHFGVLPRDAELETGLVPRDALAAVVDGLRDARRLQVSGLADQEVVAGAVEERRHLADLEVASSGRLDPVLEVVRLGRQVRLRAVPGYGFTFLDIRAEWADEGEWREETLRRPATTGGREAVAIEIEGDQKQDDDPAWTGSVSLEAPVRQHGETYPIELPAFWSWRPRLELFLPHGHALVLNAPHPDGIAVLAVEPAP